MLRLSVPGHHLDSFVCTLFTGQLMHGILMLKYMATSSCICMPKQQTSHALYAFDCAQFSLFCHLLCHATVTATVPSLPDSALLGLRRTRRVTWIPDVSSARKVSFGQLGDIQIGDASVPFLWDASVTCSSRCP